MLLLSGTTDIPTAGTAVQIKNVPDHVRVLHVQAKPGNTGNIAFGDSAVLMTAGLTLKPGQWRTLAFGKGSIPLSNFYANAATNGDDIEWLAIVGE